MGFRVRHSGLEPHFYPQLHLDIPEEEASSFVVVPSFCSYLNLESLFQIFLWIQSTSGDKVSMI